MTTRGQSRGAPREDRKLFFGEPNELVPLDLSLGEYLELALDPEFLEKVRALA